MPGFKIPQTVCKNKHVPASMCLPETSSEMDGPLPENLRRQKRDRLPACEHPRHYSMRPKAMMFCPLATARYCLLSNT